MKRPPACGWRLLAQRQGKTIDIDLATLPAGSTVKDLVSKINDAKDNPGVKATLVRTDGKVNMVLTSKDSGLENAISVNYSGDATNSLGAAIRGKTDITKAQDARLRMGGQPVDHHLRQQQDRKRGRWSDAAADQGSEER